MKETIEHPVVLCVGGHDPCGGAGIIADAEAIRAAGAFAVTVITALTDQDTCGMRRIWPVAAEHVHAQCSTLIADSRLHALKIGLVGSSAVIRALEDIIDTNPALPVILDPVLATGTGQAVADTEMHGLMLRRLIPRCGLITPNLPEARKLTGRSAPDDCANQLLSAGTPWVLITGTHDSTRQVTNRLYGADGSRQEWDWPRLPGEYHGSGCTLTSAIAARVAMGMQVPEAAAAAQVYTWKSLEQAFRSGRCQLTPNRFFNRDMTE